MRASKLVMDVWAKCSLLLAVLAVSACSSYGPTVSVGTAEVDQLLTGEALLGLQAQQLALPDDDLFALTDEMKAFVEANVPADHSDSSRAIMLQRALLMSGSLGLKYYPYVTSTAAEAFSVQQGNCLTFTALYYSLARHLGIKAYINEVDVPASWDLQGGNTYVFFRHVNVKVSVGGGEKLVVDLDMDNYNAKYDQRRISEDALRLQYFNNRAMEQLNEGDNQAAFLYLKKALQVDAGEAFVWSNLGILFKRNELLDEAEVAFRKALVIEPHNNTAASNLARLYERIDEKEKAEQFRQLADYYRSTNPYFQYHLAETSFAEGDLDEALAQLKSAIRQLKTEHRFYDLRARIYLKKGDMARAEKSWNKASELTQSVSRQVYRSRADRIYDGGVTVY